MPILKPPLYLMKAHSIFKQLCMKKSAWESLSFLEYHQGSPKPDQGDMSDYTIHQTWETSHGICKVLINFVVYIIFCGVNT